MERARRWSACVIGLVMKKRHADTAKESNAMHKKKETTSSVSTEYRIVYAV